MDAVTELLKQYYALGSEPYYRTLYLKENKQQQQLFILLHDIIFSILYSSDDANVRLSKIQWWAEECKNSLFLSTPCNIRKAKHPITQALHKQSIDDNAFMAFLNETSQISQLKKASNQVENNIYSWLITTLAPNIKPEVSNKISYVLYNYQSLINIPLNLSYGYISNSRVPKYLNIEHLNGTNQHVVTDYILAECQKINNQLQSLKGQKLPQVFITQLLLIQNILKKVKKQPKSIYNNKQHLPPLKQLFISYFSKNKQVF